MSDYHVNNPDNLTVAEAYAKGWDDAAAELVERSYDSEGRLVRSEKAILNTERLKELGVATAELVEQDKPADLKIAEAISGTERLKELGIS